MVGMKFLQSHALFGGILDSDLKKILPLLKEECFGKYTDIIKEGDSGDRLFFICKGSVEILKSVPSSGGAVQERLAVMKPGDSFGEMELIDIQPRSATVRALEDTQTLSLSNRNLYKLYQSDTEIFAMIIMNMAREISRRLRRTNSLVASSLYSVGIEWGDKEGEI